MSERGGMNGEEYAMGRWWVWKDMMVGFVSVCFVLVGYGDDGIT